MIWFGAFFDFLDGFAARLLKVSSEIGKQLDSLADMVTFGVLPGIVVFNILNGYEDNFVAYLALAIPAFSALRLAKFNIDTRQTVNFIGVPTPANAIFWSAFPFITLNDGLPNWADNIYFFAVATIVLSLLLVSELELFSLKFKKTGFKENLYQYILILGSFLLLLAFQYSGIPLIIILYITLSFFKKYTLHT